MRRRPTATISAISALPISAGKRPKSRPSPARITGPSQRPQSGSAGLSFGLRRGRQKNGRIATMPAQPIISALATIAAAVTISGQRGACSVAS